MDRFMNWFEGLSDRMAGFIRRRVNYLGDPESMIAAFILTVWTVLGSMWAGWPAILFTLAVTWTLHALAVESGNHVLLWLATSVLLVLIVISSQTAFGGLPPILLAVAGGTALGHNELVRLNYTRRRNAVVHDGVFRASAIAVGGASLIGLLGVTLAQLSASGEQRNWLWMPAAVGLLLVIGFALAIAPARQGGNPKVERWQPGQRIPPQPLGKEDLEQF
ncbi:MAG: hypothetical protein ACRBK7_16685 [Acidimicrobiales bacterium]